MSQSRNYERLSLILAVGGAVTAAAIFLLYKFKPQALAGSTALVLVGALGLVAALYYASLHQFFKARSLGTSTLVLTVLMAVNVGLLIYQTGAADSPYAGLWLLVIVAAGLFGRSFTLGSTLVALAGLAISGRDNLGAHAATLVVIILGALLSEWIWERTRSTTPAPAAASPIVGGQLKADVLMSQMADGVMVVDRQLHIQLFNRAAETLTGWDIASAQNIDYRTVMHLATADDKPVDNNNDPFLEVWQKNAPLVKNNLVMVTKGGHKVMLQFSISPLYDAQRQATGALAVFRDISQEKAVERQRNEFISTASHEMRTPVAAIEGYIALAMNPKVATIDDRARGFLDKAHNNTQHLGELFRDLLSITKLEDGQIGKKLQPVDVGQTLKDLVEDLQPVATKKGLTLTFTASQMSGRAVAPLYVAQAEPERLREVVSNLIDNAIKFTQAGGVRVGITGDEAQLTVSVTDTGVGIPPEDLPHLFQKFYRVDSSATRTIGGTGLGLYLCRNIIEAYSGRMWAESSLGKGSSFKFSLPRVKNDAPPPPPPGSPGSVVQPENQPTAPPPAGVAGPPA